MQFVKHENGLNFIILLPGSLFFTSFHLFIYARTLGYSFIHLKYLCHGTYGQRALWMIMIMNVNIFSECGVP